MSIDKHGRIWRGEALLYDRATCRHCGNDYQQVRPHTLRMRRESARVSMREVAKRLGYSPSYISDVELGRRGCTQRIHDFYEALVK